MRFANVIGVAVVACFATGGWALWRAAANDEELGHGGAWAALQTTEFRARGKQLAALTIRRIPNTGYVALSIPGVGEASGSPYNDPVPTRAWVLLNEHSSDGKVRSLPQFRSYRMPCSSLPALKRSVPDVDDYVVSYLRGICQK